MPYANSRSNKQGWAENGHRLRELPLKPYIFALLKSKALCGPTLKLNPSSILAGIQEHVLKLRKISNEVFQLLVKLRRPSDPLGTRFNTICHGDMWMGNLMFKDGAADGAESSKGEKECVIIDFHSAQFLSPATDLAHLLLTSTSRAYRQEVRGTLPKCKSLSAKALCKGIIWKINRLQ